MDRKVLFETRNYRVVRVLDDKWVLLILERHEFDAMLNPTWTYVGKVTFDSLKEDVESSIDHSDILMFLYALKEASDGAS